MLSYRHAFHAGNHADVLKHMVLVQLLRYMAKKDKPFTYIDTHAGAALYALKEGYAAKNAEYESGIARLWERTDCPPAVADYVAQVQACNPDGKLRYYPGSPQIAQQLLRPDDKARVFELHSSDSAILQQHFRSQGKQVRVEAGDGFAGLKAVLPPPSRRGVALIDPPYEDKQDYKKVLEALRDAQTRFATGVYAVWYPMLQREEAVKLPERLKRLQEKDWLHVSLSVMSPGEDGFGMHGSGMFILNPPWTLPQELANIMPWLVGVLGQDGAAEYQLEYSLS